MTAFRVFLSLAFFITITAVVSAVKDDEEGWCKHGNIYQIYPLSFKDSDNDGRGDLQGIISKVPYLKETGVKAVWLSPIYPSPMVDFGYDIADFRGIHEWYGTMDDFDQLVKLLHDNDIKLVMDFVPNHSSHKHEWFEKSVNKTEGYEDYYIWKDPKGFDEDGNPIAPNNWLSLFRGPAWTYVEERKQFYFHQFAPEQPDLNYRNPKVVQEMKDIISFWINKGVDGYRIDAVGHLFETEDLKDEPVHIPEGNDPTDYDYLDHPYTFGLPETYEMMQEWREVIGNKSAQDGGDRCLMAEAYGTIDQIMSFFGTEERPGANFPFNFLLMTANENSTAQEFKRNIDSWLDNKPSFGQSNWVVGNHDKSRIGSKVGGDLIDGMNAIATLLPDASITYYGEEIGMLNNYDITYEEGVDPQGCNYPPDQFKTRSRDFQRTPFQWDNTTNAGFNDGGKTWLPVNKNYVDLNLEAQKGQEYSHYTIYLDLLAARKLPAVRTGRLQVDVVGKGTLGFVRSLGSDDFVVTLINFSHESEQLDLDAELLVGRRPLVVHTTDANSGLKKNTTVNSTDVKLPGRSTVVLLALPSSA